MAFGLFGGDKKRVAEMIAAARTGDTEIVKQLLSKGADINAPEPESGDTPLLAAVDKGQWGTAEYLLKQRPDLSLEDKNGNSPLYLAMSRGDSALAMVNLLLEAGAQVDLGPKKGDNAGATPIHIACATGANRCLESLLRHGASATKQIPSGATPLHMAAIGGDQRTIELLCKAGGSVNAIDNEQKTPLHNTGVTGNSNVATALIRMGAEVNLSNNEGCTPLMLAVMKNHAEVAKVLLDHGADPDVIVRNDSMPLYPLFVAAMNGYDEVVRVLLDKGANATAKVKGVPSPLDAAKQNGHEASAKLIAAAIKRKNAAEKETQGPSKATEAVWGKIIAAISQKDSDGLRKLTSAKQFSTLPADSRLLVACVLGDIDLARSMLQAGADPKRSFVDVLDGITPLVATVGLSRSLEVAQLLLEAGADVNQAWTEGTTPIFEATADQYLDLAKLLVSKGANVNVRLANGFTPLIYAARNGATSCVDLFLDAGADINAVASEKGIGAFGCALNRLDLKLAEHLFTRGAEPNFGSIETLPLAIAEHGSLAFVQALQEKGCKLVREDQRGRMAFISARNPDPEVFDYLLNHGTDPSEGNDFGYTPLILAALNNRSSLIRRYLERGDDASVRDVDGETALSLALEKRNNEAVAALREFHVEEKDYSALTPDAAMLKAAEDGALGTILKLRDEGISINSEDETGNTPMLLAVKAGHLGVVRSLYHLGADINHRNHEGQTALAIAKASDSTDIVNSLQEFGALDSMGGELGKLSGRFGGIAVFNAADIMLGRMSHPYKDKPPYENPESDSETESEDAVDDDVSEQSEVDLSENGSSNASIDAKLDLLGQVLDGAQVKEQLSEAALKQLAQALEQWRSLHEASEFDDVQLASLNKILDFFGLGDEETEEPVRPPLFEAATEGDLQHFRRLIKAGADIKETLPDGTTLLMTAAENGQKDIVQEMIKLGVDVNQRKPDSFSAFLIACFLGHDDVVKTLAKHGADVNAAYEIGSSRGSSGGQTALTVAAAKGNYPICALLLKLGADLNVVSDSGYTPLMWSLANGTSEDAAELLLKAGANPDPDAESRIAISTSTTPLILASTNGMTAIVKALLKRNVAVDKTDGEGWTALKRASNEGHEEVVALLLKAGASPNIADHEGWSALISASSKGHVAICKALLKAGANANATGARGRTPLQQAIGARSDSKALDALKQVKRMLSSGDNDENGDDRSSLDLIKALLKAGANPNALHDGASLLSEAIENDDEELAKLLKMHGATEVASQASHEPAADDVSESEEEKAFLASAMHADSKGLRDLVLAGVDVNYATANGRTALGFLLAGLLVESNSRLFHRNAEQCIDYLLRHGADPGLGDPSPFVLAALGRRLHLVQAMLARGVDINKTLSEGETALFLSLLAPDAGQSVDERCALALLKAGADSSLKHESGAMPIHLAAASNYLGALEELLKRRPQDINATTNIGITPLMMAATEGHTDAVRMLVKFGADLTLKDQDGLTAKDVAVKNGNDHIISLLG